MDNKPMNATKEEEKERHTQPPCNFIYKFLDKISSLTSYEKHHSKPKISEDWQGKSGKGQPHPKLSSGQV